MPLIKSRRFILIQSTSNANVTDDNMEPYHISTFRRSTSMAPLPKLSSANGSQLQQRRRALSPEPIVARNYQRRDRSQNKFQKLNLHSMKKKSARISMRLSSVFGLSTHTVDERFNFEEQRFRAIEKFVKLFLRHLQTCLDSLREIFVTQVQIAEDFAELLIDQKPDFVKSFVQAKRCLFETTFTEFNTQMESYVITPLSSLIRLYLSPSNLIAKRHNKLLDYDSAYSTYEKIKDQQLKQTKHLLDQSKRTYDLLNSQLLDELPLLYQYSCQIVTLSLPCFIVGYGRLMQKMRTDLCSTIDPNVLERLNWQDIIQRFLAKNELASEHLFQLTITTKNSFSKSKYRTNIYSIDQEALAQTDELRQIIRSQYEATDLFIVIDDYVNTISPRADSSRPAMNVQSVSIFIDPMGDLVGVIDRESSEQHADYWLVDNGITHGYLPRSILTIAVSPRSADPPPPIPVRHDRPVPSAASVSTNHSTPIYANQEEPQPDANPSNDEAPVEPKEHERIFIALYDFQSTIDGVLSLYVGERLKILRQLDEDDNEEWWYVERLDEPEQRGYVPANYIQAV